MEPTTKALYVFVIFTSIDEASWSGFIGFRFIFVI